MRKRTVTCLALAIAVLALGNVFAAIPATVPSDAEMPFLRPGSPEIVEPSGTESVGMDSVSIDFFYWSSILLGPIEFTAKPPFGLFMIINSVK